MKKKLIEHLETYLGQIQDGWSEGVMDYKMPFQIARMLTENVDTQCFSTIGLSNYQLRSPNSDKEIRCELIMLVRNGINEPPAILYQVGFELIQSRVALLRGNVIGPRGTMFEHSQMSALYVTIPVYFPSDFSICDVEGLGEVVFIWLIPITAHEANFVKSMGWEAFEDVLEKDDPDLVDIYRKDIFYQT